MAQLARLYVGAADTIYQTFMALRGRSVGKICSQKQITSTSMKIALTSISMWPILSPFAGARSKNANSKKQSWNIRLSRLNRAIDGRGLSPHETRRLVGRSCNVTSHLGGKWVYFLTIYVHSNHLLIKSQKDNLLIWSSCRCGCYLDYTRDSLGNALWPCSSHTWLPPLILAR